ncbi:MAG: hypothetical protein GQ564_16030 [Bacteroidales bacterium]|nr:hypothetical protein [Bacteroidales bacterium]
MKFKILLFLLVLSITNSFGQIVFEQGYFIGDDGEKTECLIKNLGWKDNPSEFEYKLFLDDEIKLKTIEDIIEFGIHDQFKYKRFDLEIDRSSSNTNNLSKQRTPEWSSETFFLQVIIEGEASLYYYGEGNLKRYFYAFKGALPKQLIYKKFVGESGFGDVKTNLRYQNQLWTEIRINGKTISSVSNVTYKFSSLEKYFIKYHYAKGVSYKKYSGTLKGDGINLRLKVSPSLNYTSLSIWNTTSSESFSKDVDFGYNLDYALGVEIEMTLPFNKNKWSLFLEPSFKSYKAENEIKLGWRPIETVKAEINTLSVGLGLRHYFFLNDKSKIFINAIAFYDINFNSKIDYLDDSHDLEVRGSTVSLLSFGLGYEYNNKYSIEFRRDPNRRLFEYLFWRSDFYNYSLKICYIF